MVPGSKDTVEKGLGTCASTLNGHKVGFWTIFQNKRDVGIWDRNIQIKRCMREGGRHPKDEIDCY